VGFEPTRGDPIGLAGRRLSHSAKVSMLQEELEENLGCSSVLINVECQKADRSTIANSRYSSVAERQSCKLKVLGSIPSGG
jgi:hypothetical protein